MPDNSPSFDLQQAHRWFAANCFNETWGYIDLPERDEPKVTRMIHLAHASYHHWTQRDDCEPKHLAVGAWQLSRVYALAGRADEATRYGQRSLDLSESQGLDAFTTGYAHEAVARAADVAGDASARDRHKAKAAHLAEQIEDADERKLLTDDLGTIG